MSRVLSLIAAESKAHLSAADAERARRLLADLGADAGATHWLSRGEAVDIHFDGGGEEMRDRLRRDLADLPVDVNVLPAAGRRKRLLLADMDSTLIEQECIDELALLMGIGGQVATITERAMRGEIAFEPALRERVRLLRGLRIEEAEAVLADRITLMPGAATLVATMRAAGARTALVSGGFTLFAGPVGERLGFHESRANTLLHADGALSGLLAEPVLGQEAKLAALQDLTAAHALDAAETLAVGDGANDLAMIRAAGLGVAYRGKPTLRAAAAATIDHADLTGLLFLQGYRREEFVDSGAAPREARF